MAGAEAEEDSDAEVIPTLPGEAVEPEEDMAHGEHEDEAESAMTARLACVVHVDVDVVHVDVARLCQEARVCQEATCRASATMPQTGRGNPTRMARRRQKRQN
jgi:hypothetical protein